MGGSEYYAVTVSPDMTGNLTPPPTPPDHDPPPNKMAANERKESLQNSANFQREMDDIRKDLLLLAASITFLYLGLSSVEDIQRGLNDSRALNLTIRGLFIITKMASCVCLPSFLIHRLGCKLALIWAFCIHLIYLLASLDPRFSTMLVCASAAGLMNPVLWTAIGIYVTKMAVVFSRQTAATDKPLPTEAVINKFFAIFFCLVNVAFVVGSLVAAIVLNPYVEGGRVTSVEDYTCGFGYCNEPLRVVRECPHLDSPFKTEKPELARSSAVLGSVQSARIKRDVTTPSKTTLPPRANSLQRSTTIARPTTPTPSTRATSSPTIIKLGMNVTIKSNLLPAPTEDPSGKDSDSLMITSTTARPPPLTQTPVPECAANQQPPQDSVYIVGGLYFVFGIGGFLTVIFLLRTLGKSPSPPLDDDDEPLSLGLFSFVGSNFRLLKDYPMLLLLVLTTFGYGMVDYFFIYDYPKAYIVCIVGQHYVGFLSFCVGLLAMLSAFGFIWVHVIFCRLWMTLASTGLACICLLSLFFWKPHPDTKGVAFFLSTLWGIINAIWNIQLYSIHGHLGYSKLESSFSNLIFWWTAGHLFGFIWSELVCIYFKLYIMVTFLFLASGAVVVLELILNAPHKKLSRVAPRATPVHQTKGDNFLDHYKSKAAAAGANGHQAATLSSVASRMDRDPTTKELPPPSAPFEEEPLTLRAGTSSPYRDTPLPGQEATLPINETVLSRNGTPVPVSATPVSATSAPANDTPVPVSESPIPISETPVPLSETPVPISITPVPESVTPTPVSETPLPVIETPLPREESPFPSRETPFPVETPLPRHTTPLPVSETPFPVAETPRPASETPLP